MKILRICQETPYPPTDGVRLGPYRTSKFLAENGHSVTLVCFQSDDRDVEPIREWCDLHTIPFSRKNTPLHLLCGALQRYPVNYVKYRDRGMLACVMRLLASEDFDVVVVDYSALGWFALQIRHRFPSLPIATRWHNLDTLIWERWTESHRSPVKRLLGRIQTSFVRRLEIRLASASDVCLPVGAKDTELLRRMAPAADVRFLPAGIDLDHYSFQQAPEGKNLLFMASSYKWHANSDSLTWLHDEIMPLIWKRHPEAVLYITGTDYTSAMVRWAADPRVVLTGFVPDERSIAAQCSLLLVPMRLGGGIKLKILTAFAMGKAVVSTSQGAEGVAGLQDGANCLVRDDPQGFADAVHDVLTDASLRQSLAENARRLVCESYGWNVVSRQFESVLQTVVARRQPAELAAAQSVAS